MHNTTPPTTWKKGREAEALVQEQLLKQGHTILQTNYRLPGCEIDIISTLGPQLIATEVKFREKLSQLHPNSMLSDQQMHRIARGLYHYAKLLRWRQGLRIDAAFVSPEEMILCPNIYAPHRRQLTYKNRYLRS